MQSRTFKMGEKCKSNCSFNNMYIYLVQQKNTDLKIIMIEVIIEEYNNRSEVLRIKDTSKMMMKSLNGSFFLGYSDSLSYIITSPRLKFLHEATTIFTYRS